MPSYARAVMTPRDEAAPLKLDAELERMCAALTLCVDVFMNHAPKILDVVGTVAAMRLCKLKMARQRADDPRINSALCALVVDLSDETATPIHWDTLFDLVDKRVYGGGGSDSDSDGEMPPMEPA